MSSEILSNLFYRPGGYYHSPHQLQEAASRKGHSIDNDRVAEWLAQQAMWQIYRPAPSYIPRAKFDEDEPNAIHQADLLFLPHDIVPTGRNKRRTYKYALTVGDVASRFKDAAPLTDKTATQVMDALSHLQARLSVAGTPTSRPWK